MSNLCASDFSSRNGRFRDLADRPSITGYGSGQRLELLDPARAQLRPASAADLQPAVTSHESGNPLHNARCRVG
jgi:hypothetical protein